MKAPKDYAREPPRGWSSKWSWTTLDGDDRAQTGADARKLFEEPQFHKRARIGDLLGVRAMLDARTVDVDDVDAGGRTALHFAVGFGREHVARELLDRGAALETKGRGRSQEGKGRIFGEDVELNIREHTGKEASLGEELHHLNHRSGGIEEDGWGG